MSWCMNQVDMCIFVDVMTMEVSAHIRHSRLCAPSGGVDNSFRSHATHPKTFLGQTLQRVCASLVKRDV